MKDPFGGGTAPFPEEDPRWEEPDQKPGVAHDYSELVAKVGTWIGLALVCWGLLLGLFVITIYIVRFIF